MHHPYQSCSFQMACRCWGAGHCHHCSIDMPFPSSTSAMSLALALQWAKVLDAETCISGLLKAIMAKVHAPLTAPPLKHAGCKDKSCTQAHAYMHGSHFSCFLGCLCIYEGCSAAWL